MIGVLALQGAFLEHLAKFVQLGIPAKEVRTPADLEGCDGLVIPGGESTAIGLIAERSGMLAPLKAWVHARKPTWGTCAGMIMLADRAVGTKEGGQTLLGGLPVEVHRNFFGAQTASFEAPLTLVSDPALAKCLPDGFTGIFIRAPAILSCGEGVRPLAYVRRRRRDAQVPILTAAPSPSSTAAPPPATVEEDVIVAAENDVFLVTAFHPELTSSAGWHAYFGGRVEACTGVAHAPASGGVNVLGLVIGETTNVAVDVNVTSSHMEIARRIVPGSDPVKHS